MKRSVKWWRKDMFAFGTVIFVEIVTKYPRKPETWVGEGEEKSRELENWQEENLKIW